MIYVLCHYVITWSFIKHGSFETEKHASQSKEYTEGKSSQNLLLHQNFLEEL